MEPASADTGFFQELPTLKNHFLHDPSIQRIFKLFLPSDIAQAVEPEITKLGDEVLEQRVFDWVTDAEKNTPYVAGGGRDAFGRPVSPKLVVSEGWRKLQAFSAEKGFVSQGYESGLDQYARIVQYLRSLLFEASSANVACPTAMADGAARVLQNHLRHSDLSTAERAVFHNAYEHLVSRDPRTAWTSGQWMTERVGGSDVSQTETIATYAPEPTSTNTTKATQGPWRIDGFKWFSSATDSNMTILLARTRNGLSAFYAPMRRSANDLNGVTISRLKSKMGTKSLPTAEIQIRGMRAWLLGEEGGGIKEIAAVLTITRIRSALSALGYLSRGLGVARAFAEARVVGAGRGRRVKLFECALHVRSLADMTVEYHSMMLLSFYATYLLGLEENHPRAAPANISVLTPPSGLISPLLRVITPLLKAYVTKEAVPLLYGCMESLGGVGYLENAESEHLNLARLFRDACVLSIWEGTTDVLATDLIRALKHPKGGCDGIAALDFVITAGKGDESPLVVERWAALKARLEGSTQEDLLPDARGILWGLAEVLMAVLFLLDVRSDDGPVVREMCRRYLARRGMLAGPASRSERSGNLQMDQAIVFGAEYLVARGSKL